MALRELLLFSVIVVASANQCRFLENYVFYNISGEHQVKGVSPANARHCITKAMTVLENTISGLRLLNTEDFPEETAKISIDFHSFGHNETDITRQPSETSINCSISPSCPTFTIQSSNIRLNTDFNFICKQFPEHSGEKRLPGVDLFQTSLYELLHAFGLKTNDDVTSILYRNRDNFEYIDNGELNDADRMRVGKLYFLWTKTKN